MQAFIVQPDSPAKLVLAEVPNPQPLPNQVVVRVKATSLNRGEVGGAFKGLTPVGQWPGWDVAGEIAETAADGSGPAVGTRVVGFTGYNPPGGWADFAAVETNALAVLPDEVSFAQAATLPVGGLTTLHALYKGGNLLNKKVLITGASGGVGDFAIQLAKASGAIVTAHIRRESQTDFIRAAGADNIALGENLAEVAQPFGPFDLIVESVGGATLGAALALLNTRGTCVLFGTSSGTEVTFDALKFFRAGGSSLYGLRLPLELEWVEDGATGLQKLVHLVAQGTLKPQISVEAPWADLPKVAQDLLDRKFLGKAVVHHD